MTDDSTSDIENLIALMAKLPGMGPRSARRAVLHADPKRGCWAKGHQQLTAGTELLIDLVESPTGQCLRPRLGRAGGGRKGSRS